MHALARRNRLVTIRPISCTIRTARSPSEGSLSVHGWRGVEDYPSRLPETRMQVPITHLTTTPEFPGHQIRESLGIVTAECVLGINIFRDVVGGLCNLVGGRSGTHQKALQQARAT